MRALSAHEARRIALAAQGFMDRPARGTPDRRLVRRVFARTGIVQIDSVNVLVRSHYLPIFSRLGPYPRALLEAAAYGKDRELFEYWAHEASFVPLAHYPLLRWRMERAQRGSGTYSRLARMASERAGFVRSVLAEVTHRGPLSASSFKDGKGRGSWWGWSDVKIALEYLFWSGQVSTAYRRNFERHYDLTERVIPPAILAMPVLAEADAQRELVRIAASALGIATARDLRDYFRLDLADANARIAELVESGDVLETTVDGWTGRAYLARGAREPRRVDAHALLSPFDSLVWERSRARRLFDFNYRLEIYVPAHKRVHGYYVLPYLCGERLVARVDLKADRANSTLLVHATHWEPGTAADARAALAGDLHSLAGWLGLDWIQAKGRRRAALAR